MSRDEAEKNDDVCDCRHRQGRLFACSLVFPRGNLVEQVKHFMTSSF
jgi:hypothetical protein